MGDNRSRYVKLTKDKEQAPFQDITPGELNQPIDIQVIYHFLLFITFMFLTDIFVESC